jgi:hypothetical protein
MPQTGREQEKLFWCKRKFSFENRLCTFVEMRITEEFGETLYLLK